MCFTSRTLIHGPRLSGLTIPRSSACLCVLCMYVRVLCSITQTGPQLASIPSPWNRVWGRLAAVSPWDGDTDPGRDERAHAGNVSGLHCGEKRGKRGGGTEGKRNDNKKIERSKTVAGPVLVLCRPSAGSCSNVAFGCHLAGRGGGASGWLIYTIRSLTTRVAGWMAPDARQDHGATVTTPEIGIFDPVHKRFPPTLVLLGGRMAGRRSEGWVISVDITRHLNRSYRRQSGLI